MFSFLIILSIRGRVIESWLYAFNFQQFETKRSFGNSIFNGKIALGEANKNQSNVQENILEFNNKARPRSKADKQRKNVTYEGANALYQGRELVLNDFKNGIFSLKPTQETEFKILTPENTVKLM